MSGPNALLFLQLLIVLVTMSIDYLLVSLLLIGFPLKCLPSFDVLNYLLNLAVSCLDDENEIPLKVIASFSVGRFALPSIPMIVLHSLVRSVFWSMFSTKSQQNQTRWCLFCGGRLVITSSIFADTGSSWSLSSRDVLQCCFE